jgi:hypothetical protein
MDLAGTGSYPWCTPVSGFPDLKKTTNQFGFTPAVDSTGHLELRFRGFIRFLRAARQEIKSRSTLPWKQRFKAWRHGFSSRTWKLYGLPENDPDRYFNDIGTRQGTYRINGFYNPVIDNKLLFSRLATLHGIPQPSVISFIVDGRMYEEGGTSQAKLPETLSRTLNQFPHQVFRPTWAGGGKGIFILEQTPDYLTLNGTKTTLEETASLLSGLDRYVATEHAIQAGYASTIFPDSANTLRILTLWDYEADTPFIAAVAHRFGTSRSKPTDNWHGGLGGVCASVDTSSCTLGRAASTTENTELVWSSSHPDTGKPIEGVVIPHLSKCLSGIIDAAGSFPFCPLIGWDVLMTEDGFSVIEPNPTPSFRVWQVHEPLLDSERNRAFFRHWNLVS